MQPDEGSQLEWKFARGICKSYSPARDVSDNFLVSSRLTTVIYFLLLRSLASSVYLKRLLTLRLNIRCSMMHTFSTERRIIYCTLSLQRFLSKLPQWINSLNIWPASSCHVVSYFSFHLQASWNKLLCIIHNYGYTFILFVTGLFLEIVLVVQSQKKLVTWPLWNSCK